MDLQIKADPFFLIFSTLYVIFILKKLEMAFTRLAYWLNLLDLLQGRRLLRPLNVTYYLTTVCNLNCNYCEDFGLRRNSSAISFLPLEQAQHILGVIRTGCDHLIITGGEPLLVPHISSLLEYAKETLRFKHITILTNASLLRQNEEVLQFVDRIVVSLDQTDPSEWSQITGSPATVNTEILENLKFFAPQQRLKKFNLVANCVITPGTVDKVQDVLNFCIHNHILASFSPQSVNNWPHYDLLVSHNYQLLIDKLIYQKRHGAPILASLRYLNAIKKLIPYPCYPALVPRIWTDGSLIYPCRPIEKENGYHGGRPCNLLELTNWADAMRTARYEYGEPPRICSSCFQQCYAEASLMQAYPLSLLREAIFFPVSRRCDLSSHAPG